MISRGGQELVGRCGLYCGSCMIYRAGKDSEKLRRRVAENEKCKPEEIRCESYQTVAKDRWNSQNGEWGKNCRIVKCQEARGLSFCHECSSYPSCEQFRNLAGSCLKRDESLTDNLNMIKAGRVDEWLRKEEKKWRCCKCGKPVSMHLAECHWCGAKIFLQTEG